jgi:hypothetical protein
MYWLVRDVRLNFLPKAGAELITVCPPSAMSLIVVDTQSGSAD